MRINGELVKEEDKAGRRNGVIHVLVVWNTLNVKLSSVSRLPTSP
jgi:hypothetical protein